MTLCLTGTPSEINELLNKLSTVVEDEEVEIPKFTTGYDIEQYDATEINLNYIETYKGFKIYKGSYEYLRWWKTTEYESRSNLESDINKVHQMIDDHIIRLNR